MDKQKARSKVEDQSDKAFPKKERYDGETTSDKIRHRKPNQGINKRQGIKSSCKEEDVEDIINKRIKVKYHRHPLQIKKM